MPDGITASAFSWFSELTAFLFEVEAGEVHVRRASDFQVALGAEHHVNIVPEPLDQTRFIRGGHTVMLGPREGFLQQRAGEGLRSLRQHNAFAGDGGGDESDVFVWARA